jgi:proteasome lid subunit RPN8/RPN11
MKLSISADTMAALQAHACETYPDECCGMVVERDGREEVARVTNLQNDLHAKDPQQFPRTARTAYSMRWADVEPLLNAAYKGQLRLRAVYHSHPEHDAYFSAEDRAAAEAWLDDSNYAGAGQIVLSVRGGEVKTVKAFAFDAATREYIDVPLIVA